MIRKFLSSQEKSSGPLFLVFMAGVSQQSIHKFHQKDFLAGLLCSELGLVAALFVGGMIMHFALAPKNLSVEKLSILVKSQNIRFRNYDVFKIYLFLVPVLAYIQYLLRRNETDLAFWHFLLSTAISISIGFLARSVCSYFLNRRIQVELDKT